MDLILSPASVPSCGREATPELERRPFDQDLWVGPEAMEIDPPDATTRFQHRLKQYNKWTDEFAARVTKEYRRFLYLAARAGHPVTPSDTVDQAWHLHLIYTRHYWEELCGKILGCSFVTSQALAARSSATSSSASTSTRSKATRRPSVRRRRRTSGRARACQARCAWQEVPDRRRNGCRSGYRTQGGQHSPAHLRRDCRYHRLQLCRGRCAQPGQARR